MRTKLHSPGTPDPFAVDLYDGRMKDGHKAPDRRKGDCRQARQRHLAAVWHLGAVLLTDVVEVNGKGIGGPRVVQLGLYSLGWPTAQPRGGAARTPAGSLRTAPPFCTLHTRGAALGLLLR